MHNMVTPLGREGEERRKVGRFFQVVLESGRWWLTDGRKEASQGV